MAEIPRRDQLEKELAKKFSKKFAGISKAFASTLADAGYDIYDPKVMDLYKGLDDFTRAQVQPFINNLVQSQADLLAKEMGIGVNWNQINEAAVNWARNYSTILAGTIGDTNRERIATNIRQAIGDYFEEGITRGELRRRLSQDPHLAHLFTEDVKDRLGRVFGPRRAEMIARTEVTRAAVEGERFVVDQWREKGINMQEVWHTRNDEIVCPICGPRNLEPIENPKAKRGGYWDRNMGPPAHPNCRCWIGFQRPVVPRDPKVPQIPEPSTLIQDFGQNAGLGARDGLNKIEKDYQKKLQDLKIKKFETDKKRAEAFRKWQEDNKFYIELRQQYADQMDSSIVRETLQFWDNIRNESNSVLMEIESQMALIRNEIKGMSDEFYEALRQSLFVENPMSLNVKIGTTSQKVIDAANEAIPYFEKFVSNFWDDAAELQFKYTRRSRAYFDGAVNMGPYANPRTGIHEMGHWLEENNPQVKQWANEFLDHRTPGEDAKKLSEITGHSGYRSWETAKEDKFLDAYMGKIYSDQSTELISMGLEYFYKDPLMLAQKDPEMFDFIYNLVRGVKSW